MIAEEKWESFIRWRMKLAARVVQVGAGRLFDPVLMPDPVVGDVFAFYEIIYTFFRIYLSLPQDKQDKFKDLAEELAEMVKS